MKDQDNIKEELEQLAPGLSKLQEQPLSPPSAPDGYFDGLADQLLDRVQAERQPPLKVVWRSWAKRRLGAPLRVGIAAAVLLVLSISVYLLFPAGRTGNNLSALSEEEARAYIVNNIDEFSVSLMLEAELVQGGDEVPEIELIPGLEEEEVEDYLYELLEEEGFEELF